MKFETMAALEQRRLLSVSAHIRLLGNTDVIQAGQSVHVNALPSKSGAGTNFGKGDAITSRIAWSFGDKHGAYNKLPGFTAGHVYEKPGTYKLTLRITDPTGESDTASRIIKVVSAKRRAIYVNPWGNDRNNGGTPDTAVATVARAQQLLSDSTALYFRSGMTFKMKHALSLPFKNVIVGAYGKGKTPRIRLDNPSRFAPMFLFSNSSRQITIENLYLYAKGSAHGEGIRPDGTNITIKGIDFENLDSAIMASGAPTGLLAYNNVAGPTRSYFAYVKGSDQAFLGNIVSDSTEQHNIRIYGSRILCYGNDMTNYPDGSSLATLRVNNGADIYWSGNILRAGQVLIGPLGPASAGATADESVNTVVVENNRWKEVKGHWSIHDRIDINPGTSSVMIRNNYIDATNANAISATTSARQVFSTGPVHRTVKNVHVISNTAVNPGATGSFLSVAGVQTNAITLKDSLYVAPDLHVGPFSTAAVRVVGRPDLKNFTSVSAGGGIQGNVWNLPSGAYAHGVNYVSDNNAGDSGYRTPSEWSADFPGQVKKDHFEKVLARDLNANGRPKKKSMASFAGAVAFAL
jgi:hypothetical protein